MSQFESTKVIDGFSACFRQHGATDTHCKFLHGYSISFEVTFTGQLDHRNWVMDFGFMKRSKEKIYYNNLLHGVPFLEYVTVDEWFRNLFDHTVIIASDDPEVELFHQLSKKRAIELRLLPDVGCEMFAKLVAETLDDFCRRETSDRVRVTQVKCFEHSKNSATFKNKV